MPYPEARMERLGSLYAVLSQTSLALVQADNAEGIFDRVCKIAVEHGDFKLAWIGLVDEESGVIHVVAAYGETGYLEGLRILVKTEADGMGPTGIAVREGTYFICNDFLNDDCTRPWHDRAERHGLRASASIAIKVNGKTVGALTLYAGMPGFFDPQTVELLQQLGAAISFTLDKFELAARTRAAEQALQEETAERLRTMESLREKEQLLMQQSRQAAMGEMIGNIAHQWRQPLNTLGLMVQELPLVYDVGELNREFLRENVEKTMEIIRHMSQTIDDFRNFFKPDKEKVDFDVAAVVKKTISLVKGSFNERFIRLQVNNGGAAMVHGYPNEFSQVMLNILDNARDAFPESAKAPQVTIDIGKEGEKAVIVITDNAGGIAEDDLAKIFEPYFTTKGPDKGTGVGLFMAKTIIERNMGGRLTARNTADGAEFTIEV